VAVVGPPAVAAQLNHLPGEPLDARPAPSRPNALSQINDREAYGAYEVATNRLFVASAANRATAVALEQTFNLVAAAQKRPAVHLTDVKPLPSKDPNGTAAFYAVVAWMFGGYIAATLIGLIGSPRSASRKRAAGSRSSTATASKRFSAHTSTNSTDGSTPTPPTCSHSIEPHVVQVGARPPAISLRSSAARSPDPSHTVNSSRHPAIASVLGPVTRGRSQRRPFAAAAWASSALPPHARSSHAGVGRRVAEAVR